MHESLEGDRGEPRMVRAATAILLVGAALRLAAYLAARSLWLDEAMLANNIVGRTFGALLGPLGESQTAPWLFLLGERAVAVLLGPNELALRLLPLAAGVVLPWVVWLTGKRLVDQATGLVAAAIAALSPLLLYYSNEVKPYGIDALVSIVLVLVTLRVMDDPERRERWTALLLVGMGGLLSAFPATFVLAGCWCALAASAYVRKSPYARRMLPLAAILWGTTFALPYFLVIRAATTDAFLTNYFNDRFLVPWEPSALTSIWRLWQDLSIDVFLGRDAVARLPRLAAPALCSLLFVACAGGLWEVRRRRGIPGMLLVAGPMAIALLASTLRLYPLTARLWAFSAPLWAALVAAGVVSGARALQGRLRTVAVTPVVTTATACLMAVAGFDAAIGLASPYWRRAHIRPLIRALEEEQRSTGDPIYVMPRAAPQWLFYTSPWHADPAPVRRDSAAQWLESRTCTGRDGQHGRACQMLGGYSSVTYAEVGGFAGQLDTAWAAREISRVRAAASPCAWVLMHLPYPGEPAALARAVDAQGGRVDKALEDRAHPNRDAATKAFRVCFDTPSHAS